MSDPTEINPTPTPSPAVPVPQAAPIASPSGAKPLSAAGNPGGRPKPKEIRIPVAAFKERVRRDSNALAREALGMTLEEARAKLAGAPPAAGADPAGAPGVAGAALEAELRKTQRLMAAAEKRAQDAEARYKRDTRRLKDERTTQDMMGVASRAGVLDAELDYTVGLLAKAIMSDNAITPPEFFKGLKTSRPHLFNGGAATPGPSVVTVPAGTAPRESASPGEARPTPSPVTGGAPLDVDTLSPQAFSKHLQSQYGYRSGM